MKTERIPSLDGFRAMSILLILFHHSRLSPGFPGSLGVIAKQAEVGVTIFFVISGFLITNLLLKEQQQTGSINIKAFYIRRAFRILPVYALYLVFMLLWRNIEHFGVTTDNLIHILTFSVNFDNNKDWFLGHFWSLSVEEQFYLFWPLLLVISRKHIKIILIILLSYCCVARCVAYKFPDYSLITLAPFFKYADAIFIGAWGGILFFENPGMFQRKIFRSYIAQLVALCFFLMFIHFLQNGMFPFIALPFGNGIISLSVLFLILCYVQPSDSVVFKILNNSTFVHIGILSYSIYIWQQFFFLGELKGIFRTFPYNILIIYFVSLASYYLWEKPFLRLKNHFMVRRQQPQIKVPIV